MNKHIVYNGGFVPGIHAHGDAIDPIQVAVCREWIARFALPRKTINVRCTSYALKHDVEHWKAEQGVGVYVSNGAFITAAIDAGYRVQRIPQSTNCHFNIRVRA